MSQEDVAYYILRARQECRHGLDGPDRQVARVHLALAAAYLDRLHGHFANPNGGAKGQVMDS